MFFDSGHQINRLLVTFSNVFFITLVREVDRYDDGLSGSELDFSIAVFHSHGYNPDALIRLLRWSIALWLSK